MQFEQHWPRGFRGEVIRNYQHFSIQMYGVHTNAYRSKRPCRKKVKCQCMTNILATLVDLPSRMIYAKIQPQGILGSSHGILGSGDEDF